MGNILFCFKKRVRIMFVGLDASGKTTTLYRLKHNEVVFTIPTVGFNVETVNHEKLEMEVFDVGGTGTTRHLYDTYLHNTEGIVFFIDSNDTDR